MLIFQNFVMKHCISLISLMLALSCGMAEGQDEKEDRIGGLNLYQGDDASALLQEAFAQAGVDLDGPISPVLPVARRPSLVDRLRNMKLPSLPSFSAFARRKVTPVPNILIPISSDARAIVQKTGRALSSNAHLAAHLKEATFIPAYNNYPSYNNHASFNPPYTFPKEQAVVKETLTASPSFHSLKTSVSDAVVGVTAAPTPMPSRVDNQISGNSKTVNNSFKNVWTPSSHYFGGFKPIPSSSSSQGSVSAAPKHDERRYEKSHFLSGEETKRVSFFESLDPGKSALDNSKIKQIAKSLDIWRFNNSVVQELSGESGRETKFDNKLFPINPALLLEQLARINSNRTSQECKNKDLGWCDFSESYPEHFVLAVIKECRDVIERMYVEVPQNLADFDDYVPFSPIATSTSNSSVAGAGKERAFPATWSWAGYTNKNNALCDADRKFVRPSVAQDITGRWFVIVQSSLYHQQIPTELCRSPGGVCNNISECGLSARCVQKFNTQLLVSIDLDKDKDCPSMRLYRFPSGCVCDNASYY